MLVPLIGLGRSFIFRDDNQDPPHVFKCALERMRCSGTTKAGQQCRRNVILHLDKCFQHLKSELGLLTKPSSIPGAGTGLWTVRNWKRGDKIVQYHGEILTDAELDERYGPGDVTAPYTVEEKKNKHIDAACNRSTAAFINHQPNARANTRFAVSRNPPAVWIVATKNIQATKDEPRELFINYGRDYHFNQPGVSFRTT